MALIIGEEESLILYDCAAHGSAENVEAERRPGLIAGIAEPVVGAHLFIACKPESRPMKIVRSAASDNVDHAAAAASELRAEAIGQHFKLLRAIRRRGNGEVVVLRQHDAD